MRPKYGILRDSPNHVGSYFSAENALREAGLVTNNARPRCLYDSALAV